MENIKEKKSRGSRITTSTLFTRLQQAFKLNIKDTHSNSFSIVFILS